MQLVNFITEEEEKDFGCNFHKNDDVHFTS